MRKISVLLVILILLLGSLAITAPAHAADKRVVGTPDYVVFLKDDGSLEYYEVIKSQGFYIGFTRPGWRNDRSGRVAIDVARRADGARAELWHLKDDQYYVDFYRANGGLLGSGSFSAAGIPGGQNFTPQSATGTTASTGTTTVSTTVTTTTTTTGGSGTVYTVVRGDTLYSIAVRFGRTLGQLMAANGIANANLIYAGQRLIIP